MQKHYIKKALTIGNFEYQRYFSELELEKENLLFTDLIFYIDNYYQSNFDKKYLYHHLLFVFNNILKRFFQAPLKLTNTYKNSIKGRMTEYLLFRNMLVNDRYEKEAGKLLKDNPIIDSEILENIDKENYLRLISSLYDDLDALRGKVQVQRNECQLKIKDFDRNSPQFKRKGYSIIAFLQDQIKTKLDRQLDFFLIQGSYATADFVKDWSDLDTFVILNKAIFNDAQELTYTQKRLQKLSLLCYKINPVAHHTFFIFPDLILRHYLNVFLPIPVLQYAVALKKKNNLFIQQVNSHVEELQNLWVHLTYLREKVIENNYPQNLLHYEIDIAQILILPALMLQMRGEPIYKKFAFEKVGRVFPNFDLNLIDVGSKKRSDWVLFNLLRFCPNIFFTLPPNKFSTYFVNKYRYALLRFKHPTDLKETENFTKRVLHSYETFFNYCLRNYKDD